MKDRIIITPREEDRLMIKDGKKYRLLKHRYSEEGHVKEVIFEEFDEVAFNEKIERIAEYLINKSGLDAKTIVKDILKQMETTEVNRIEKQVIKEEPVKQEPGCIGLRIGKRLIPITY